MPLCIAHDEISPSIQPTVANPPTRRTNGLAPLPEHKSALDFQSASISALVGAPGVMKPARKLLIAMLNPSSRIYCMPSLAYAYVLQRRPTATSVCNARISSTHAPARARGTVDLDRIRHRQLHFPPS